jgi:predicted DNA-binding protein (MmcQ/YjbR family)
MTARATKRPTGRREAVLSQCGALSVAELDYPFGEDTAVFKVVGKMFAMVSLGDAAGSVTLKCEPEESEALRQAHSGITPGYYMNKRHWISIDLGADLPPDLVTELVRGSYDLVVASLPAKHRPTAG